MDTATIPQGMALVPLARYTYLELVNRRAVRTAIADMMASVTADHGNLREGGSPRALGRLIHTYVNRSTVPLVTGSAPADIPWTEVALCFIRGDR